MIPHGFRSQCIRINVDFKLGIQTSKLRFISNKGNGNIIGDSRLTK